MIDRPPLREVVLTPAPLTADAESLTWIEELSSRGRVHDEAVERLHALLLRAARFEVGRRRSSLGGRHGELEDLATRAADDALMAILRKLGSFRGASRFTTWAYKFALLEAAVQVRRHSWQEREIPLEAEGWARLADQRATPDKTAEQSELMGAVQDAITNALTPHQRSVLVALVLNDVPIDVLAERLGSSRGALYKTLHDARRTLRARLAESGADLALTAEGGAR